MIEYCKNKDATQWLALSFFHTDEDITEWTENQKDIFINIKFTIIESMISYPFIKKIVIPIDAEITEQFIKDLMKTNG
jgi:hypothetical protein